MNTKITESMSLDEISVYNIDKGALCPEAMEGYMAEAHRLLPEAKRRFVESFCEKNHDAYRECLSIVKKMRDKLGVPREEIGSIWVFKHVDQLIGNHPYLAPILAWKRVVDEVYGPIAQELKVKLKAKNYH